ncbi:uncharacterized protein LOC110456861 [Mizuhopecten yessoensis]|uniref:uncharacterized protein LOC110456861 n=1 Tax=Mizuhopecten yessoensis TaxID=6573 RepID=UPI000B45C2D9|nr:uncharacterized protein LOC110456861 [Mizuhopecten yessoensis]
MHFSLTFVFMMVCLDITLQRTTTVNEGLADYCADTSKCMCKARNGSNVPKTTEELEMMIATLISDLRVDKKRTTFYKSKLISATDDRTSSRSIGFVAIFVICVPAVFIVAMDISRCVSWWRHGDPKPKHRKPNVRKKKITQKPTKISDVFDIV